MEACLKAANELYDEISAKNPEFKKVYDTLEGLPRRQILWWQVAEYTYENFSLHRTGSDGEVDPETRGGFGELSAMSRQTPREIAIAREG